MSGSSWTPEQLERMQTFAESGDPSDLAGEPINNRRENTNPVSSEECAEWREYLRESPEHTPRDIGKSYAITTIRKHGRGRCQHPEETVGEPAEGPPQGPGGGK